MLHLPISQARGHRVTTPALRPRADHSMNVLQYGTAGLALVVVALLAVLR